MAPCNTFSTWLWLATALLLLWNPDTMARANGEDLKPGDVIGPHNWQRVEGMVGENLLRRIKQGYTLEIKESTPYRAPAEYVEMTARYSHRVRFGSDGRLTNHIAGLPFPDITPTDPRVGEKLAWNFYWRWLGDDYKTGGATQQEKIIRDVIEKDGSERRADIVSHTMKTRGRVTVAPKPFIPGYNHIDWMQLRADEYPRDTSGTTTLEIRYADPDVEDDFYIYIPSIRRIRRVPPVQRCATIAPSEFNFDDINSFNGKITNFRYRYLGKKKMLANLDQKNLPFHRKKGDYLPLDESWEVVDAHGLEITPKDPDYCYPRKVIYLDSSTWETVWVMIWDKDGNYWKEQFGFRNPVELPSGQHAWSVATVVMLNVQNGRATIITASRTYNQGYKPGLFSLATLQKVLRGGSIR